MIVVTGTARIAAGARDELLSAAQAMVAATRAEPGCRECRYALDIEDPEVLAFVEVYDSMDAMRSHLATDHMRSFYASAEGLMAGRPDVSMWVGAEKGTMGG